MDYVLQRARRIDPRQVLTAGTNANIYVGVVATLASVVVDQLAESVARLLLDAITDDDDLDRYALDRYTLTRKGASAARGSVNFFRASNANGAGSVPVGTRLKTIAGIEYITTTQANFAASGPASLLSTPASVRAVQAGKTSQVGANAIRGFSDPTALFDQSIQVTNPLATAGGEFKEDLDTFKSRVRDFWTTARRGTLGAIAFGALTVPGVVSAEAFDVVDEDGTKARLVQLYIADSSGVASAELAAAVAPVLDDYRAGGIQVLLTGSIPTMVSVAVLAQFSAGVDTAALVENIRAAIVEYVNSLPVNGVLDHLGLASVLRRFVSSGLLPAGSSVAAPAGDLVPAVGQTIRTTSSLVTVNGV